MRQEEHDMKGEPTKGHLDENALAYYAEYLRGLHDSVPESDREHVERCARCRQEIAEIDHLLDQVKEAEVPYGKSRRPVRWKTAVRLAGAVAAVFVLAWLIQWFMKEPIEQERIAGPTDSLLIESPTGQDSTRADTVALPEAVPPEPADTDVHDTIRYAEAFKPHPGLEALVGIRYRNVVQVQVKTPQDVTLQPGDTLLLIWDPLPEDTYQVRLVNNRDEAVLLTDPSKEHRVLIPLRLSPGLYYWKLETEEELVQAGRVKVMGDTGSSPGQVQ